MGPLGRRLRALERRLGDKDFNSGAPPVDEDGLPVWDGATPLSVEGYMAAMGFAPDAELTDSELEARHRLGPYREIFETLQRDADEKEEPVV